MGTRRSGPPKGLRFRPTGPLHHRWPAGHLLPTVGMGRLSLARSQGSGSPGRTQQGFRLETANVLICDLGVSPRTHGLSLSGEVTAHRRLCPGSHPGPCLLPARTGWTARRTLVDAGEEAPWASCAFSCVSVLPMSSQGPHPLRRQSPPPPSDAQPPLRHIPGWELWSRTDSSGSVLSTGPGDGQSVCQAFAGFP